MKLLVTRSLRASLAAHHQRRAFNVAASTAAKQCQLQLLDGDNAGVALLTLARPEARNALGKQMMVEFRAALDAVRFDTDVRVLVLQSTVAKVFCAGADLKERVKMTPPEVRRSHTPSQTMVGIQSRYQY
jgi:methylglutaconyl-CoA hydratase